MALCEECRIAFLAEMLEGADGDNAVDWLVELLPALQTHLRVIAKAGQACSGELVLLLAERQSDCPHVVFFDGPLDRGSPATADIKQALARLQIALAEGE